MSRITKNKKRIDPRYFLNETAERNISPKAEVHEMTKGSMEESFKRFLNENPYKQPTGGKGYVTADDIARRSELEDQDSTGYLDDGEYQEMEDIKADMDKPVTAKNEYMINLIMSKAFEEAIAADEKMGNRLSSIGRNFAGTIADNLYSRFKGSNMDVMMPYLQKHIDHAKRNLKKAPRKHRTGIAAALKELPDVVYKRFTEF